MKELRYIVQGLRNIIRSLPGKNYKLIWKLILNYGWAFFKIPFMVPQPLELQIEPSLGCNLRCEMCNISRIVEKTKVTFLTKENFNPLLNQLLPLRAINFTGMGESLLNQELEAFILQANSKDIETLFITNGQLLSPQRIEKIIASDVERIVISMESGIPAVYEVVRRGASFSKLKGNIENLTKKIKELNLKLKLSINIVLLKHNIENLANIYKIIDLAKQSGISEITLQNPHDISTCGTFVYFNRKKSYLKKNFQLIKSYAEKCNIRVFFPATDVKEGSCHYPWIYPQITASGELLPCCIIPQFGDYEEITTKYSFGNVFSGGFDKVWNSEKANAFRRSLSRKKPNRYCRKCSKYLGIL